MTRRYFKQRCTGIRPRSGDAHLPPGARDVAVRFDPERMQMVLEYDLVG